MTAEPVMWKCCNIGQEHNGGQVISVKAPIEIIPLFTRDGAELPI